MCKYFPFMPMAACVGSQQAHLVTKMLNQLHFYFQIPPTLSALISNYGSHCFTAFIRCIKYEVLDII